MGGGGAHVKRRRERPELYRDRDVARLREEEKGEEVLGCAMLLLLLPNLDV